MRSLFSPPLAAFSRAATAAVLALGLAGATTAAPVRTPHVEAELVAARTAIVPGEPLQVALRLRLQEGWHTYWRNPGDSGLPTTLAWTLPAGITAGPIDWPAPHALPAGPLVNYGYEGEVFHLVTLDPAATLAPGGEAVVAARADWLVCKETCIPEGVDLSLTLPVRATAEPDPRWAAPIAAVRAALPQPLAGWDARAEGQGTTIALRLTPSRTGDGNPGATPGELRFFPHAEALIEPSAPQPLRRDGDAYVLTLPVASTLAGTFPRLDGVLTATGTLAPGAAPLRAATLDLPLAGSIVAGPKPVLAPAPRLNLAPAPTAGLGLALAVAFALAGGVLLNLMPCVFPVLSLKIVGFATHRDSKATMRREAGAFAAGVVATFVTLGLLLVALRAAGEQLGWGFQLQSPGVVTALAILFFVLALNLSGVFEFGQLAPSGVAGWTSRNRAADAFGSGVLAVVIASPCTAPFMGAALGYALSGSIATTLAVFGALGVGMALPYVLLAWFPGWRRRLPRPGPWLVRFKQLLAFPLYGTAIWLAWVLGTQRDNDAVLRLLVVLLIVGFALWAWHNRRAGGGWAWGFLGAIAFANALVVGWPLFAADADPAPMAKAAAPAQAVGDDARWLPFTPTKVGELTGAGRTVFVDFTAAWCVTCQVNKRLVLNADNVRAAFAKRNVALVRADWTRRDPEITRALAALGRNGVPVYVLYRPGKEPLLLPEVLQRQTILDALGIL
jgi:thiol:disulfide interchange protein/DsbC/DsbD-like thiol-disulfide interchange protein